MVATILEGEYTDADNTFTEKTELSVSDYVAANGWPAFRQTETEILQGYVQEKRGNHVIGLGGGIVETEGARTALAEHIKNGGIVVHITRELEDIEGYLDSIGSTAVRPNWGESFAEVFKRREPWYQQCSNYEFFNTLEPLAGQSAEDHHRAIRGECRRFFRFITASHSNRPRLGEDTPTTFLSLTFPDIRPALSQMEDLTEGADAVELRVDLLAVSGKAPTSPGLPPLTYVAKQLSMLRLVTPLPIVYSVRSKDQGGFTPSDKAEAYREMVELGIRLGCEYVDLEVAWPGSVLDGVSKGKRNSHIIASWHDWTGAMAWDGDAVQDKYAQCSRYGNVVKIVGTAKSISDNAKLSLFASKVNVGGSAKPLLAINMGAVGQLSRITNPILTPITHPALPSRAAPGQLSAQEIYTARSLMGLLPTKKFYLFGKPISASVSPTLHNTGFEILGLPHRYERYETDTDDEGLLSKIKSDDFGGASVTIPLKLKLIPHLDSISEDAKVIGAINTIVPSLIDGKKHLQGENTDWQAIKEAVESNLTSSQSQDLTALVIGAGGTCRAAIYAMHKVGATRILLFNRTASNAETVKDSFPSTYSIEIITSLHQLPHQPSIIVSTVPGDSLTTKKSSEGIYFNPENLLSKDGGVVIDMAYKPYMTPLLHSAEGRKGWKIVSGVEILCLQGFRQFKAWTGKDAPKGKIRKAVLGEYFGKA